METVTIQLTCTALALALLGIIYVRRKKDRANFTYTPDLTECALIVGFTFAAAGAIMQEVAASYSTIIFGRTSATATDARTSPTATSEPVAGITGVVIKSESDTEFHSYYYWVTFERDGDKAKMTYPSEYMLRRGDRVHVVTMMRSIPPGAPPNLVDLVVLDNTFPRKR